MIEVVQAALQGLFIIATPILAAAAIIAGPILVIAAMGWVASVWAEDSAD